MGEFDSSDSSDTSSVVQDRLPGLIWESVTMEEGEEVFAQALQCLGMELAKAVPQSIRDEAITPLGVNTTSDHDLFGASLPGDRSNQEAGANGVMGDSFGCSDICGV